MNLLKLFFATTFLLLGFVDSDIDGVEDKNDLCPDTPFDKLVNENGCAEDNRYLGSLTLQVSNSFQMDSNNTFSNYGLSAYYNYHNFSFSLSNAQQTTLDTNNNQENYTGDFYLDMGYLFKREKFQTKVTIGSKIATANEAVGTGENDYYGALMFNYNPTDNLSAFSRLSYTLVGDTPTTDYQNSFGYSLGLGYLLTPHWYSSLSYNNSNSIYADGVDYEALSWYNSYNFNQKYFMGANYRYGLDELSFDHTLTLSLGVNFD